VTSSAIVMAENVTRSKSFCVSRGLDNPAGSDNPTCPHNIEAGARKNS
jgi:hypothetical protein